ncbi:hypothetical protein B0T18DRAFT_428801 [Schizothecium vesticola]|uniref:Rhodopsin domain-containing protein n=1 Tax=Schizothecium vesticola TaxID=314040 RepID=A0AA40K4K4_9PEZI|nr:hypothetical protein B0T18DRAFT_428801 [Schizothecium vesticola]
MSAGPPPPFVEPYPGFSQETKGPLIVGVMTSLTALTLFFVIARMYSKRISSRTVDVGDWLVIISMVLGFWYLAMAGAAVHYGGGRHMGSLSPTQATNVIKITVISFVPGVTSFVVPKFAVVILLAKLLNPSRIHIYIMWIICVIYSLLIVGMLTINFAQCTPAAAAWGGAEGVCWDRQITVNYALTVGIMSVLFDFYLAIYPSVVLWQLHLNWKKKLALCSSLGFGYCAGFITIYKCTTFQKLVTLQDFSYALGDVVLWTNIEANFVLIGACIPTLFPLMRKLFGASVLGGSSGGAPTPGKSGKSNGMQTFGSHPNTGKIKKSKKGLSQFDTVDDGDSDSKYIILEERSFHYTARDVREEDAPVLEQVKASKQPGW